MRVHLVFLDKCLIWLSSSEVTRIIGNSHWSLPLLQLSVQDHHEYIMLPSSLRCQRASKILVEVSFYHIVYAIIFISLRFLRVTGIWKYSAYSLGALEIICHIGTCV